MNVLYYLGAHLSQDRGKLEAKIEVLTNEVEILKKQREQDSDAIRIKNKIVDDQTETIRRLKEVSWMCYNLFLRKIKTCNENYCNSSDGDVALHS